MLKASFLALACALALGTMAAPVLSARAEGGDDVFLDEGDSDFGSVPVPGTESTVNIDPKPAASSGGNTVVEEAGPSEFVAEPEASAKRSTKKANGVKKHSHSAKVAKSSGRGRFMTTKDSCPMMREPASEGDAMITVKPMRKIWVEEVDQNWVRGFNKSGEPGYLKLDCF